MFLKCLGNGMFDSNCYILGSSGEAAVIDAGVDCRDVAEILESQGLALKYVILTHAHVDHILHAGRLRDSCGGKIVIHAGDAPLLADRAMNGSAMFGVDSGATCADLCLSDGDILEVGGLKLEIIHTPGHTPGSACIMVREAHCSGGYNILFTGDTLFKLGVGRTDLGGGDGRKLAESLKRLMELDDSTIVYPGHGPSTSIGFEKRNNPYIGFPPY